MADLTAQYPYPRNRLRRGILKAGIGILTYTLSRFTVLGKENIPQEGPLIVVTNHFHFLDAALLILAAPWPLEFLADFEMPNVPPVLKFFPDFYGTYDVAQGKPNLDALYASEAILAQEGVLGVFPEGRVHQPPLMAALPGAAFLALRTGAPILPVGVFSDNHWDIFGTIREKGRRIQATCRFGKVFELMKVQNPRRPTRDEIRQAGEQIMAGIARQLPPEMRGAYATLDAA
jgi:1-acyl-sn-glycerol-3-phosphate acyltransferase